jgi:regulatory protein
LLDDGREIEVAAAAVDEAGLTEGMAAAEQKIQELGETDAAEKIHTAALRLLRVRARSERDIRTRLRQKEFAPDAVDAEIARLRNVGLLDDTAFARAFVEERSRRSPRSARLLRQELSVRGVSAGVATASTEGLDEPALATEIATAQLRKRQPRTFDEFVERAGPFLTRRGFSFDVARGALRRAWDEARRNP